MKKLLKILSLCLIGLFGNIEAIWAQEKPNVVIIFIDDMGFGDLSSFGNQVVSTPNMDALAERGLKLTNFYVNSPICSPSRTALNTGYYPLKYKIHSYLDNSTRNAQRGMNNWLDADAETLAKVFKKNGYRTGHFGKWHLGGGRDVGDAPLPQAYGFDQSLVSFEGLGDRLLFKRDGLSNASSKLGKGQINWVEKYQSTGIYVDSALSFIGANKKDPFYVHLFPNDVHDPHLPMNGRVKKYEQIARSKSEARFFAVLENLDEQIGRFMVGLEKLGKLDNTIIVFTSDNGPTDWASYYNNGEYPPGFTAGLHGRKWSLYEGGIRMPFIISWPGKVPMGAEDNKTVMTAVDLKPTLLKLTNLGDYQSGDGEDRSDAMLGNPMDQHKAIMWEYASSVGGSIQPGHIKNVSPNLAILDNGWKLLINADSTMAELYHLEKDPFESNNQVEREVEKAQKLAHSVLKWRRGYEVPIKK
ncbi:sulfatase family protein [Echinicola shivajiensis]|uniref:sulfatase family protein n=1 Tax=Echinicola shivajiensis TaxID=1035916 RepID=UPI001BFC3F3D|nr:sulfatase-like hydrolase/transferase [Echinicola shivajiensis]